MTKTLHLVALAAALALAGTAAHADGILTVASYDTPNGDGQAHSGQYNYWDTSYDGSGATTTDGLDGSVLTGGKGKLTDNFITHDAWYDVSNAAGTGPYVGWRQDPTITFHFATSSSIDDLKFAVDNTNVGGVSAPSSIIVNGTTYSDPNWLTASGPTEIIDLNNLNIHGDTVTVTLVRSNAWVFVSEAQFFSTSVPEPAEGALLLAGLGLVGGIARRRRG